MSINRSKTQTKIRMIYKEIASEQSVTIEDIELCVDSMWSTLKGVMMSHPLNALYLRHLGTFYGREGVYENIKKFKELKNGS